MHTSLLAQLLEWLETSTSANNIFSFINQQQHASKVVKLPTTATNEGDAGLRSIQEFIYQEQPVRTKVEGDKIWFVAKDVCDVLGKTFDGHTLQVIPASWQGSVSFTTPGGNQELKVISEEGLYKLIFRSNKPEADRFTNYVANTILPTIRKTGSFHNPNISQDEQAYLDKQLEVYRTVIAPMVEEKEQSNKSLMTIEILQQCYKIYLHFYNKRISL